MAVSNQEIADQLWQVVRTDYALATLAAVCVVYLLWLLVLSFRRPKASTDEVATGRLGVQTPSANKADDAQGLSQDR